MLERTSEVVEMGSGEISFQASDRVNHNGQRSTDSMANAWPSLMDVTAWVVGGGKQVQA